MQKSLVFLVLVAVLATAVPVEAHEQGVGNAAVVLFYVTHSPGHPPEVTPLDGWTVQVWHETNGLEGLQKAPSTIGTVDYPADERVSPPA